VIVTMGGIPTAEYATPGTAEVSASIRQAIRDYDALILAHHGSLTVGHTLWEAYMRLEKVEHTAEITLAAQQLGRVNTLAPQQVDKLVEKRRDLLQREGRDICEGCTVCLMGDGVALSGGVAPDASLAQTIAQSVLRNLTGDATRR
jgi:L-fuculose-phosphate aldolase